MQGKTASSLDDLDVESSHTFTCTPNGGLNAKSIENKNSRHDVVAESVSISPDCFVPPSSDEKRSSSKVEEWLKKSHSEQASTKSPQHDKKESTLDNCVHIREDTTERRSTKNPGVVRHVSKDTFDVEPNVTDTEGPSKGTGFNKEATESAILTKGEGLPIHGASNSYHIVQDNQIVLNSLPVNESTQTPRLSPSASDENGPLRFRGKLDNSLLDSELQMKPMGQSLLFTTDSCQTSPGRSSNQSSPRRALTIAGVQTLGITDSGRRLNEFNLSSPPCRVTEIGIQASPGLTGQSSTLYSAVNQVFVL